MEHIPAIHAAKVGMRYPARVKALFGGGLFLELDLSGLAPGRAPKLTCALLFDRTLRPMAAGALSFAERFEVVLIQVHDTDVLASLPADPAWLTWNNGTVRNLARRIRETGETVLLPVLADALEEAGCRDTALLEHCRRPFEGTSWVVDLLATQE